MKRLAVFASLSLCVASVLRTHAQLTIPPNPTPAEIQAIEDKLNDWPFLARYRKENAALPPPAPGEKRVVFMGDSITDHWGNPVGTFFPGEPYLNRGIAGQTTAQILLRFQQDAFQLNPVAIVVLAGYNDIAGAAGVATDAMIEDNFESMVELARQNNVPIILASILPSYQYQWRPDFHPAARIASLNKWIKAYAARQNLVYLDYYSSLVDSQGGMAAGLSLDGVHPSAAGYAIMAPLAEAAITQALQASSNNSANSAGRRSGPHS